MSRAGAGVLPPRRSEGHGSRGQAHQKITLGRLGRLFCRAQLGPPSYVIMPAMLGPCHAALPGSCSCASKPPGDTH